MATKKAGKKKAAPKKSAKKTAAKKTGAKRDRKRSPRKKLASYVPRPDRIERFMCTLIESGYMGKTIADNGKDRKRQAGSVRQMAEVLDRQLRKADDASA